MALLETQHVVLFRERLAHLAQLAVAVIREGIVELGIRIVGSSVASVGLFAVKNIALAGILSYAVMRTQAWIRWSSVIVLLVNVLLRLACSFGVVVIVHRPSPSSLCLETSS